MALAQAAKRPPQKDIRPRGSNWYFQVICTHGFPPPVRFLFFYE
jgi:hypothetical protein